MFLKFAKQFSSCHMIFISKVCECVCERSSVCVCVLSVPKLAEHLPERKQKLAVSTGELLICECEFSWVCVCVCVCRKRYIHSLSR